MFRPAVLCLLAVCLAFPAARAHEGHFYSDTFSTVNATSILVAQCSSWSRIPASTPAASIVDASASGNGDVTVTGTLKVYASLKYDCAGQYQTTLEPNVTMTRADGSPLAVVALEGFVQTGTCAQGGGERYNFDASRDPEDLDNQLLIASYNTTARGTFGGIMRQDHMIQTGGANGPTSFVFYYDGTNNPISCCNLVVAAPGTNYTALLVGKGNPSPTCLPPARHGSSSSMSSNSSMSSPSGMAASSTPSTTPATSGAVSAVASMFMVLLAVIAPLAFFA